MFYEVIIWSRDTVPLSFLFFSQSSVKGPSLLKTLLILTATTHEKEFQRMIKNVSALFPFFHFCCLCITTTWMDSSLKPVLANCKGITHFDESKKQDDPKYYYQCWRNIHFRGGQLTFFIKSKSTAYNAHVFSLIEEILNA